MSSILEQDEAYKQRFEAEVNRMYRPQHARLTDKYQGHMIKAQEAKLRGDTETMEAEHDWMRKTTYADDQVLSDWQNAANVFTSEWLATGRKASAPSGRV